MNFVPVRRGGDQPVGPIPGPSKVHRRLLDRARRAARQRARTGQRHPIQILDLTRLPVPMHKVMNILLLLPFGALITAFMRNVVGMAPSARSRPPCWR